MPPETQNPKAGRKAAGSVVAVAVLQIVAAAVAATVWVFSTIFAGNACSPSCDWASADRAGMVFTAAVVGSFIITAAAALIAWRKAKDLAWVPFIGIAVIVAGLISALSMFHQAMS